MIKRYAKKEMSNIWTDQNKFNAYLLVEKMATEAFCKLGVVPDEDYQKIMKNASFDLERISEIENETRHDVVAFTRAVSETLGPEKKWIHYGLTSTDVVDTANAIILKEANTILKKDLDQLIEAVKKKAIETYNYPCIGRTHGVHADITSFGLKWALWYDELLRDKQRLEEATKQIEVGKISGAVGNFANAPIFVQDYVCEKLQIASAKISTQTLQRDRHAFYVGQLALLATTFEKIATEIRHLQRTEVREVEEGFAKGQKGSSAMPHKRNPISSENICGCARVMRGYMLSAYEDVALWHERDISHSSVERIILPDATTLLDYMMQRLTSIITNLKIFPEKMLENIDKTKGVIFAQRVMSRMIEKGVSREEAYDYIQQIAMESWTSGKDFRDLLDNEQKIKTYLTKDELYECYQLKYYLRNVKDIYQRVGLEISES